MLLIVLFWSVADPREWTEEHVVYWLNWAIKEFSLVSMNHEPFLKLKGRDIIELGKDKFLAITPAFTGDILWEHLDILQKGKFIIYNEIVFFTSILVIIYYSCGTLESVAAFQTSLKAFKLFWFSLWL